MKQRFWAALLCTAAIFLSGIAGATVREARTVPAGAGNWFAVADPVTGRAFVVNTGSGRGAAGSVTVIETDGSTRTLSIASTPGSISIAPALRKVLVIQAWDPAVVVIDADTLQQTTVAIPEGAVAVTVLESLGRAYIAHKTMDTIPPWINAPHLSGSLTELDLSTFALRTFPVSGMLPRQLVADEGARRVLMTGVQYFRTGEGMPGFLQSFDAITRTFAGTPVRIGRLPADLARSPSGAELYLLGHRDFTRDYLPADDMRRNGMLPAIFVVNAANLSVIRTIDLPDTTNLDLFGDQITGNLAVDPAGGRVYALDENNARFSVVDPASGSVQVIGLESFPRGLTFDPVGRNLLATFPFLGYVGVYSSAGVRLDSVPMSKAARMGVDSVSAYAIAVDPVRGTAFATNSLDGTVTILKAAPALANTVVNMTDLWWNPADSGWGVFLEHQGTTLFATLFLRAADGSPRWYVMSGGVRNGDGSFSGALYRTTGPLATSIATIAAVGTMRITPHDLDSATLLYDIDGATHSSPLSRLVFTAKRSCGWTAGGVNKAAGEANFTALWYDAAQPGWGISLSHRGDTIFGVLFSYDAQNRAVWWSMSNGARQADGSFAGTLYRISGSGLLTVGTMALSFTSAGSGVMTYEADGERVTRPIGRNVFAALVSDCGGPI